MTEKKRYFISVIVMLLASALLVWFAQNSTSTVYYVVLILYSYIVVINIKEFVQIVVNMDNSLRGNYILGTGKKGVRKSLILTLDIVVFLAYVAALLVLVEVMRLIATFVNIELNIAQIFVVVFSISFANLFIDWIVSLFKK